MCLENLRSSKRNRKKEEIRGVVFTTFHTIKKLCLIKIYPVDEQCHSNLSLLFQMSPQFAVIV